MIPRTSKEPILYPDLKLLPELKPEQTLPILEKWGTGLLREVEEVMRRQKEDIYNIFIGMQGGDDLNENVPEGVSFPTPFSLMGQVTGGALESGLGIADLSYPASEYVNITCRPWDSYHSSSGVAYIATDRNGDSSSYICHAVSVKKSPSDQEAVFSDGPDTSFQGVVTDNYLYWFRTKYLYVYRLYSPYQTPTEVTHIEVGGWSSHNYITALANTKNYIMVNARNLAGGDCDGIGIIDISDRENPQVKIKFSTGYNYGTFTSGLLFEEDIYIYAVVFASSFIKVYRINKSDWTCSLYFTLSSSGNWSGPIWRAFYQNGYFYFLATNNSNGTSDFVIAEKVSWDNITVKSKLHFTEVRYALFCDFNLMYAYMVNYSSSDSGAICRIYDISNPQNPTEVESASLSNIRYVKSVWTHDGNLYFFGLHPTEKKVRILGYYTYYKEYSDVFSVAPNGIITLIGIEAQNYVNTDELYVASKVKFQSTTNLFIDDDKGGVYDILASTGDGLQWRKLENTDDLPEGQNNLYYTDERVDDRVAALLQDGTGLSWTYDDDNGTLTGNVSLSPFSTDDLSEGSINLYFTDARAISAVEGNANVFNADQTLDKTGTATSDAQYPSYLQKFKCSVWDSGNSQAVDHSWKIKSIGETDASRFGIFDNGDNEILSLKDNKVGISITSMDYKLHINGEFGFNPGSSVTPVNIGDVVIEATNDTTLTFKLKGSDGVVRSGTLTLN